MYHTTLQDYAGGMRREKMKYKLRVDLSFPTYKETEIILKGTIFEVFMVKEVGDKIICYCKTENENWQMYLDTLNFFAEEYVEPQKRKTCSTCKFRLQCYERANKTGLFFIGDTCMRYEELQEPDKPTQESESAEHL